MNVLMANFNFDGLKFEESCVSDFFGEKMDHVTWVFRVSQTKEIQDLQQVFCTPNQDDHCFGYKCIPLLDSKYEHVKHNDFQYLKPATNKKHVATFVKDISKFLNLDTKLHDEKKIDDYSQHTDDDDSELDDDNFNDDEENKESSSDTDDDDSELDDDNFNDDEDVDTLNDTKNILKNVFKDRKRRDKGWSTPDIGSEIEFKTTIINGDKKFYGSINCLFLTLPIYNLY